MFYMLNIKICNIIGVNLNNIEVAVLEDNRTKKDLQTRFVLPNNCKMYTAIGRHYPNIIEKKVRIP